LPYLIITFAITWGILALYVFLPERSAATFGELSGRHPLFFLAVWAPALAAFIVVLWQGGLAGFRRYLSRTLIWRCSPVWYGFLLVGIPLLFFAGAALKGNFGVETFTSARALVLALFFMAVKGPIEEFGWRGLALPTMQRRLPPVWAGILIGIIWGLWHLPAFMLSGTPQGGWSFTPFFLGAIALSVIVTALFNSSGGSILLAALFHFLLINPILPDARPYDTYLFLAAGGAIVWINRRDMFSGRGAPTKVIPTGRNTETGLPV
jgi:hypothetical protein